LIQKQGQQKKNWKKRWAKLGETKLSYYASQNDSYAKGEVEVETDSIIMFVDENQIAKKNCFAIVTQKRHFYMSTDLEDDMCSWVYHLRASVYYCNLKKVLDDPRNFLKGGAAKTVEKRGHLKKQGGRFASMKKRYFVLKDGMLNYYKSEKDLEPIDSIDLRGTKVEEKTNRISKEYAMILHTDKRQFFFVADTPGDQHEWIECMQSVCKSLSEAETIQTKSHAIHNLILSRMIHGKESKSVEGVISPHSPLMWRTLSFHRSKPQYLEGATTTTATVNSSSNATEIGSSNDITLLKRNPTTNNIVTTSSPRVRSPSVMTTRASSEPVQIPQTTSERISSQRITAIQLEDEQKISSSPNTPSTPIADDESDTIDLGDISDIDLKKQKKSALNLKKKEKHRSFSEDKEIMDRMMRDTMTSHLQTKTPSSPMTAGDGDEFEDLMLQEERMTDYAIQVTPISQVFKKEDDGKADYSSEEEIDLYSDEDDDGTLTMSFTTTEITEKPTLKMKKNEEGVTLQKRVYTRDMNTPSSFKRMHVALEHQFRVLNVM
jgi:hypothetical protein